MFDMQTLMLISIHALRKESDMDGLYQQHHNQRFQSTLSVRRATCHPHLRPQFVGISIHALRKESDRQLDHVRRTGRISIHALRKESDPTN